MGLYTKLPSSFLAGVLALLAVQNVQAMPHASVIGGRFTNSSTTASVRPGGMTVSISPATTAAPPRQSSTGSHRIGIMDIDPNMPHDPNPECRYWWDNDGSIACDKMPRSFKITMEQWLEWASSLSSARVPEQLLTSPYYRTHPLPRTVATTSLGDRTVLTAQLRLRQLQPPHHLQLLVHLPLRRLLLPSLGW